MRCVAVEISRVRERNISGRILSGIDVETRPWIDSDEDRPCVRVYFVRQVTNGEAPHNVWLAEVMELRQVVSAAHVIVVNSICCAHRHTVSPGHGVVALEHHLQSPLPALATTGFRPLRLICQAPWCSCHCRNRRQPEGCRHVRDAAGNCQHSAVRGNQAYRRAPISTGGRFHPRRRSTPSALPDFLSRAAKICCYHRRRRRRRRRRLCLPAADRSRTTSARPA